MKYDKNQRVVSGMRSTGRMHLGHLHGALKNWVKLQYEHECLFFAADWHALTTHYEDPKLIAQHSREMIEDWLAVGLNPANCKIFIQSQVPEHATLHLLLSMMTPLSWLERIPTYKEQRKKIKSKNLATYGFLGYPLLQSADVLLYKANLVPVGEDQVAHIELIREVARRFNHLYGVTLTEPQPMLTKHSKMVGLDGQKMSKSYNNTIGLTEDPDVVKLKVRKMPTDPARIRRNDPGTPEKCPVWELHKVYSDAKTKDWVQQGCTSAGIGCIECKSRVTDVIVAEQEPIRLRLNEIRQQPNLVDSIVEEGAAAARDIAKTTLQDVSKVMGLVY